MENNLVNDPIDIFRLKKGDLLVLPRMGEKSVDNILESIEGSRDVSLGKVIASLSIDGVGEETAFLLAENFTTIEKLAAASQGELEAIPGIGDIVALAIVNWFENEDNRKYVTELAKELNIEKMEVKSKAGVTDKSFVFTGTLPTLDRDEGKAMVKKFGGDVSSSVSKNTDYVVAGESAGSKLDKAEELGVKILDEKAFKKLF